MSEGTPRPRHAPGVVKRARRLRNEMTASERALWKALRALDRHIRRQAPIGRYVVDFVHHGARLVIEVDSGWHDDPEAQLHDAERDAWLAKQGYRVMRVRDGEAFGNPYLVAERVAAEIQRSPHPNPSPSRGRASTVGQKGRTP
ncbi:endonuclease domain-containing protein [Caulobacter sp. CCH5-E12]|uniref:endonuclease domain-containing protein n=1 Tax=Caulobacter sp. CCH5-E12 TaxID=1768770 RepID=UPI0035107195